MNVSKELAHDMRCMASLVVQALTTVGPKTKVGIIEAAVNLACQELCALEDELEHAADGGLLALRLEAVRKRLELAQESSGILEMLLNSGDSLEPAYVAYRDRLVPRAEEQ